MRSNPAIHGLKIQNNGDTADVLIYDYIGAFGVEASDVVEQLQNLDVENVNLRINSPGGDVFDGFAIANAVKQHKANVTVNIEGLCASAATVIALAGDEVVMHANTYFMIHNAWSVAIGNADEMREQASLLDRIDEDLANFYAEKTGKDVDDLKAMMSAETWMNPTEAKENGFINTVYEDEKPAQNRFDLSVYKNAPKVEQEPAQEVVETFDSWSRRDAEQKMLAIS